VTGAHERATGAGEALAASCIIAARAVRTAGNDAEIETCRTLDNDVVRFLGFDMSGKQ